MIINAITLEDAVEGRSDEHGQRYVLDFATEGLRVKVTIRTAWIVDRGGNNTASGKLLREEEVTPWTKSRYSM